MMEWPGAREKGMYGHLLFWGVAGSFILHAFFLSMAMASWGPTGMADEKDSGQNAESPELSLELKDMHKLRREIRRNRERKDKLPPVSKLTGRGTLKDGSGLDRQSRLCMDDPEMASRLRAYKAGVMRVWNSTRPQAPGYAVVVFQAGRDGRLRDYYIRDMGGGKDFRLFLRDFLHKVMRTTLVEGGSEAPDMFECEFRVRAALASENGDG